MIDRATLLERQLPERYVAGQLSPEETAEFEEYLLENPDVIDQVEIARQFRLGLRTLSQEGKLAAVVRSRELPRRWLLAAGVAAIALMVGLASWFLRTGPAVLSASIDGLGAANSRPIAGEFMLARTRGSTALEIPVAEEPEAVLLRLEAPQGPSDAGFRIELLNDEREIASVADVRAGADGLLSIYLNTAGLEPGDYLVSVSGGKTAPERHPLRLVPRGRYPADQR